MGIDGSGVVHEGSDAVMTAYSAVGLGWLMAVLRIPLIRFFIDGAYSVVSSHRHTISRWLPGGKALTKAVESLNEVSKGARLHITWRMVGHDSRPGGSVCDVCDCEERG